MYLHLKPKHISSSYEKHFRQFKNQQTTRTLLTLESYYWKEVKKDTVKNHLPIFPPALLIDLLQYPSKTCLILHLRFPLINAFLLLDFFLEISIDTFHKSQL